MIPLAIVPFQPCLHAVLIEIWAAAQSGSTSTFTGSPAYDDLASQSNSNAASQDDALPMEDDALPMDVPSLPDAEMDEMVPAKKCLAPFLDVVATANQPSSSSSRLSMQSVRLPTAISSTNAILPLNIASIRRSPWLNQTHGFQHAQLSPKKRKRRSKLPSFTAPIPVASIPNLQGSDLGPISEEILQG